MSSSTIDTIFFSKSGTLCENKIEINDINRKLEQKIINPKDIKTIVKSNNSALYINNLEKHLNSSKNEINNNIDQMKIKLAQIQKEEKEISRISKYSKKFSSKVISTAVNIVERNLSLIQRQYLKNYNDLVNNNNRSYLVII